MDEGFGQNKALLDRVVNASLIYLAGSATRRSYPGDAHPVMALCVAHTLVP
jgi:hypothetical protein